jgi:hypothetical protein
LGTLICISMKGGSTSWNSLYILLEMNLALKR